ncbi:MAG: hypothetical protein AW09_000412 [Candidatus Accumulibacter phosphatis]|uniref:Uncharacterized protein n=1 Tax=Candidatus Accumulibacter phosphatis TaxID=327160 RepID=A0A080LZN8_9PROT|nr:MAG: hypothetical protein AW09_000412 [Candidatus Accumulibacter phosphatis]
MQRQDIVRAAQAHRPASMLRAHAGPWLVDQPVDRRQQLARTSLPQGCPDRMLRSLFESRRQRQTVQRIESAEWQYVKHTHLTGGQRPGLVEDEMAGAREGLDGMTVRHQQTGPGHRPAGHRQCHRSSQRQCTGTGDDQHRNRDPQHLPWIDEPPDHRHRRRQKQQGDDEAVGNPVSEFNDARLLGRRTLHQTDDRRQARRLADLRHLDQQRALDVDRPGDHERSRALADRRTLTGEERLIGATLAFNDLAVRRNRRAGSDQNDIAAPQIGRHHLLEVAIRRIRRDSLRYRRHQPGQRLGDTDRALAGRHFQESPAQ